MAGFLARVCSSNSGSELVMFDFGVLKRGACVCVASSVLVAAGAAGAAGAGFGDVSVGDEGVDVSGVRFGELVVGEGDPASDVEEIGDDAAVGEDDEVDESAAFALRDEERDVVRSVREDGAPYGAEEGGDAGAVGDVEARVHVVEAKGGEAEMGEVDADREARRRVEGHLGSKRVLQCHFNLSV